MLDPIREHGVETTPKNAIIVGLIGLGAYAGLGLLVIGIASLFYRALS